ncbi:MoaD/ThiS family protein [Aestuariivivens marinum]|uniref:MoaD/ThiS family protein n=1 Tax=Aestuariivivens marinum TaxID=2913555 RepID=UPI001F59B025|nr:MoaD/ThiS family protein [Aestuariivivens marinum]
MHIKIKYFGQIAEVTKCDEEIISLSKNLVSELIAHLYIKYPELKNKSFKIAQNQELVSENIKLTGKEIALLPPFAGG